MSRGIEFHRSEIESIPASWDSIQAITDSIVASFDSWEQSTSHGRFHPPFMPNRPPSGITPVRAR